MGEKCEGFTGKIIKDTWRITRMGGQRGGRWVRLGFRLGWEEKAEKCT